MGVDDVVDLLAGPGVAAPLGLHLTVDDGVLAAAALGAVGLLESSHQTAVLSDAAAGGNACDAAAHHGHIHVNGLGDLALVDLRLGTQPVLIGGRCSGVAPAVWTPIACSMQLAAAFLTALVVMVAPEMLSISVL